MKELKCMTCGKHLEPEEECDIHGYTQCINCAFPNGNSDKLLEFERKRIEHNNTLKLIHNKNEKKRRIKVLLIGLLTIILLLAAAIFCFGVLKITDQSLIAKFLSGTISGTVLATIFSLRKKKFKPLSVQEYNNYLKSQKNNSNDIQQTSINNNDVIESNQQNIKKSEEKYIPQIQEISNSHIIKVRAKKSQNIEDKPTKKEPKMKFKTATIVLSIMTILFAASTIGLSIGLIDISNDNQELSSQITDLENTVSSKDKEIAMYKEQISNLKSRLNNFVMSRNAENNGNRLTSEEIQSHTYYCTNNSSPYYHTSACPDCSRNGFTIWYDIDSVENAGYLPCPNCIE